MQSIDPNDPFNLGPDFGRLFRQYASTEYARSHRLSEAQQRLQQERLERLRKAFGVNTEQSAAPKFKNIEEMMAALAKRKHAIPDAPKPVSPEQRIKDIEAELDIYRGRVPTPKGFKSDPSKVKALMAELKKLKSDTGRA